MWHDAVALAASVRSTMPISLMIDEAWPAPAEIAICMPPIGGDDRGKRLPLIRLPGISSSIREKAGRGQRRMIMHSRLLIFMHDINVDCRHLKMIFICFNESSISLLRARIIALTENENGIVCWPSMNWHASMHQVIVIPI